MLTKVLRRMLEPLTLKQNPSAESGYFNVICADSNFSHCKPALAESLADYPEYKKQHLLERHICVRCECPKTELGDHVPPDKQLSRGDHNLYRTLSESNTKVADAELTSRHVHWGFNVFRHIPNIMSDLPKPDFLHTKHIGIHDCLQKLIFHFIKMHEWLDKFIAIWLSVPAYQDLTLKHKSGKEFSQWNGKGMKEITRYLLGVVPQSLEVGSPAQHSIFNPPIQCTWAMLEFYMNAQYKSQDDATMTYM